MTVAELGRNVECGTNVRLSCIDYSHLIRHGHVYITIGERSVLSVGVRKLLGSEVTDM